MVDQLLAFGRRWVGRRDAIGDHFFAGNDLPAERGHLDDLHPELDVREPEPSSDDPAVPKELLDLIRMCGGADVEILRPAAEEQVADAAAHEVGHVMVLPQTVEHLQCIRIDIAARDRVLFASDDTRGDHVRHCSKRVNETN